MIWDEVEEDLLDLDEIKFYSILIRKRIKEGVYKYTLTQEVPQGQGKTSGKQASTISAILDGVSGSDDPLGQHHTVQMKIREADSIIEVLKVKDKYLTKRL